MSIRLFFDQWPTYNQRVIEVVGAMTSEQLAIRPAPSRWPVWATAGHMAGMRVYWLCDVLGEPGEETTPWPVGGSGLLWEDVEDHPRTAEELVGALESTWRLVDRCLDSWTPEMMGDRFSREMDDGHLQWHTRTSVLQRMFSHDAYHCGELSQTLGIEQMPQIDLWGEQPEP
jgi:uncharacterized damage-inducible protein DinB